MLKSIFAALLISVLASTLYAEDTAQDSATTAVGIKVMLGAGLPSYEGVPGNAASETGSSFSVGVFHNWSSAGKWSFGFQPEFHFVSESGGMVAATGDSTVTTTVQSLRIPILFKLQLGSVEVVQPSIYAGPSLSFVVNAENESGGVETNISTSNALQVGLAIGADVTFFRNFLFDLRYETNFTKVTDDLTSNVDKISIAMGSIRAGIGLRF